MSPSSITDPPMFIQRPISLAGDRDERVTLGCLVDSNPAPSYAWYRVTTNNSAGKGGSGQPSSDGKASSQRSTVGNH